MAIFRGTGGAGDSTTDATVTEVTQQATNAAASATAASSSASSAATSASNAATSESNAATSATNAATSESNASTSATNAASSATTASTAATAAQTAQTAAEAAQTAAETAETNAASSATSAASSATSAASSASAASTSETNAATSESNASTSATNAASSATSAASAQTAAETAQTAAEAAQTEVEAIRDSIESFYLGAEATEPTTDDNGNALTAGDWYFNTTDNQTYIYNGTSFQGVSPDLIGDTTPQLGGNLDTNGSDILVADDDSIKIGTGNDLVLSHSSSTNISTLATSSASDVFQIKGGTSAYFQGHLGYAKLFGNTSVKLETTSTGVDITGTVNADTYTGGNVSNWDTAYGWGDHSTAGYLTSFTETNDLSTAVTWANVPDANITQSSVTQHQAALSIANSQVTGLGTAATLNVGTSANNVVQLDGSGALPAVDGSNLTNVSSVANLGDLTDVSTTGITNGQTIVYNSGTSSFEPGTAGGNTAVVGWENQITVAENYTMTSGNNMVSAGPITIDTGYTVTVPTGSRWVVV